MPRRGRKAVGGIVYHVLNRGCGKMKLFSRDGDYAAFEKVMSQALERTPVRLLSYCLMPNHWHLMLWPRHDGELSRLMFWLTMTHTQRWRHARQLVGLGPLYQGRFKAFPVETDAHYLTVCRYVERNALRANLVSRAQDWKWSSLNVRLTARECAVPLHPWPVPQSEDWLTWVNEPQTDAEVQQLRARIRTGRPFGSPAWERHAAERMGLNLTPKPRGRPRKGK
jgi:putative transposase